MPRRRTPASGTADRPRTSRPGTRGWSGWPDAARRPAADPLPRRRDRRRRSRRSWRGRGAGPASTSCSGRCPSRCRCDLETTRVASQCDGLPPRQGRVRHRGDDVGAGLPAGAPTAGWRRARPCWPSTATGRASPRRAGSSDDRRRPTATTPTSWPGAGYVVLAPDLRCFGERLDWNPPDHYACDTNLVHAVMAGSQPAGARTCGTWPACLDVLEPPIPSSTRRASAWRASPTAAPCTLFLAASTNGWRAAVVSGYFSSWAEAHKMPWNMCGSQVLPGMLGQLEHVDLGALVAPRPLLVESGTEDDLFPLHRGARPSMAELRARLRGTSARPIDARARRVRRRPPVARRRGPTPSSTDRLWRPHTPSDGRRRREARRYDPVPAIGRGPPGRGAA